MLDLFAMVIFGASLVEVTPALWASLWLGWRRSDGLGRAGTGGVAPATVTPNAERDVKDLVDVVADIRTAGSTSLKISLRW